MPPWLPEPGYGEFVQQRRLTDAEIGVIQTWVEQGAVEGDPMDLVHGPAPLDVWQLGQPDLVVRLPEAFTLNPGSHDVFRNFVLPPPISATRYVRALEFQPGGAGDVHHATIGVDPTRVSRGLDDEDPQPGYEGMFSEGLRSPMGHFLGWTPGNTPRALPADMAWELAPGADLVVQLHMLPTTTPSSVQPSLGLFFTDRPPSRTSFVIKLGSKTIDIPAGTRNHRVEDSYRLPADVEAVSVYPHAHYLARDMRCVATLPDGTVKWLIWIKQWNFHLQDQYQFAAPVFLPRGTLLTMQYTYDNSLDNLHNPHHPPRQVMFGPQSEDEMADLWLQVVLRERRDMATLAADYIQRELRADVELGELRLRHFPDSAKEHNDLGAAYLRAGRVPEATDRLNRALRLDPANAAAHNNLGNALQSAGRIGDAIGHFGRAAAIKPDYRIYLNLGSALRSVDRNDEALSAFAQAVKIGPQSAEAHNNLAVELASRQDLAAAIEHFERALEIDSSYADAHNNIAVALAQIGRSADAIRHLRRALQIRPGYPDAEGNLKALLAKGPL